MITKESWGRTAAGKEVLLYTLTNANGMKVQVTSFGARLVSVWTPDRNGALGNVIVGPDTLADFESRGGYRGATVGRYCNRIGGGSFELDGQTYELTRNEGANTLHGGSGVQNAVWESAEDGEQVVMTHLSPDGTDGFPGNMTIVARFQLGDDNRLVLTLQAATDKATVCSLTNHAFWNLGSKVLDCELQIGAESYLDVDAGLIPTAITPVEGTRFDFRSRRAIGELYDHHFIFNGSQPQAKVWDPATGRTLEVITDLPGTQLYTSPDPEAAQPAASAFCLEPQFNPDSPHHADWPSTTLRPGEVWDHTITLAFGVE